MKQVARDYPGGQNVWLPCLLAVVLRQGIVVKATIISALSST